MIPCYICGKDAATGWTKGFAPAPDSQKMALCIEHNNRDNRMLVSKAWRDLCRKDIFVLNEMARQKNSPAAKVATVHFTGGGLLSFTCTACAPTAHGTLRIDQTDNTLTFIPMQHIREYSVRPLTPGEPAGKPEHSGKNALVAEAALVSDLFEKELKKSLEERRGKDLINPQPEVQVLSDAEPLEEAELEESTLKVKGQDQLQPGPKENKTPDSLPGAKTSSASSGKNENRPAGNDQNLPALFFPAPLNKSAFPILPAANSGEGRRNGTGS